MSENMGLRSLNERLQDPSLAAWFGNLFPRDSPRSMRFSINFFTSIGLGGLTDALRRHLVDLPKILAAQRAEAAAAAQAGEEASPDAPGLCSTHQPALNLKRMFGACCARQVVACQIHVS